MAESGSTGRAQSQRDPALAYRHRFGAVEFDEAKFELRVGGLRVDIQRKPLQILARLLSTPGEVVDKQTLFAEVWDGRATGDAVLANAISKLRAALGPAHEARLVTVPRRGFRLDGPVERMATGRRLESSMALRPGDPAPGGVDGWLLGGLLSASPGQETWWLRGPGSEPRRVRKYAFNGERLAALKREVTLNRLLLESVPHPESFTRVLAWDFETEPYWIESAHAGDSLDRWAAEDGAGGSRLAALSRDQRLALVLQIVDAVAMAHEAGVLHKDLKPGNVLVQVEGTQPRARLTDFGSAALLDEDRLEELRITRLGLTVQGVVSSDAGTPLYLAPELLAGQAPSARSDLYALGVMAYQVLAGDLLRVMAPGWEREFDDALLREDLAAATDVDPQRRPASVAGFAGRLRELPARRAALAAERDLQARHAALEAERQRAHARRPWIIAALLVLLAGGATSLWLQGRAARARDALAAELDTSSALNRLLQEDLIGAANPARRGRADITVADALAQVAAQIDVRFAARAPAVRAQLHGAVQSALSELSRSREAVEAGRHALAAWQQAEPPDAVSVREVQLRLAVDLVQLSELTEAAALVTQIEGDTKERPLPPDAEARLLFAKSWVVSGDFSLEQSLQLLERARMLVATADETQAPWRDKILFALADNYTMLGRHTEGEALFRELHADQVRRYGEAHARPAYTLVGLGRTLANQRKYAEAERIFAQAIAALTAAMGPAHRMTLTARDQLANVMFQQKQYAQAAEEWRVAQQGFTTLLGAGSSYTITLATNRGMALHRMGNLRAAEALLRDSLVRVRAIVANDSPQAQQIRYALAEVLLDEGRRGEVPQLLEGLDAEALNLAQQEPDWADRLIRLRARAAHG
jgi:eukaryotic-like serine/threonine-protein kinase